MVECTSNFFDLNSPILYNMPLLHWILDWSTFPTEQQGDNLDGAFYDVFIT